MLEYFKIYNSPSNMVLLCLHTLSLPLVDILKQKPLLKGSISSQKVKRLTITSKSQIFYIFPQCVFSIFFLNSSIDMIMLSNK